MPITRTFLGWQQPALVSAVNYLFDRFVDGSSCDLDEVVVVTPGSRAGRRLLELLVETAESRGLLLVPPRIETAGRLPELLYEPQRPFASDVVQQLAWVTALRRVGVGQLTRITLQLPDSDDLPRWMELGALFSRLHRELAADGLDFSAVLGHVAGPGGADEEKRWRVMRRVQEQYLETLDRLELWDLQTARLVAIRERECQTVREIVLIGAADLNVAQRQMLDQISHRVTALIFAPPEMSDRFDEHGCLRPEAWQAAPLPLKDERVLVADGPNDQADMAAQLVARLASQYSAAQIVVGAPDETLAPQLQRRLEECGARARWGVGRALSQTAPVRLLRCIADYVAQSRAFEFASLVRHPDVDQWLRETLAVDGWLAELDAYFTDHMQAELGEWLGPEERRAQLEAVHRAIEEWLAPLRRRRQPLSEWTTAVADILQQVYTGRELDPQQAADHECLAASRELRNVLLQLQSIPPSLAGRVTSEQALRIVLDQCSGAHAAPLADEAALEILGWLELPLDTAPAVVVTSVNEGFVPTSVNGDMFLPNALRRRLRLVDNQRRYARDAYALSSLVGSRETYLIVGRRDTEGDPLTPSRLLFADNPQTIARRVLHILRPDDTTPLLAAATVANSAPAEQTSFVVPRPDPVLRAWTLPVTALKTYLMCPYRFYLRYVLRLETCRDDTEELDAAAFGSLLHQVLGDFGAGEVRDSANVDIIRTFLDAALDRATTQLFGSRRLAPVNVQVRQLRMRLDAFAEWQARRAAEGWRIHAVEAAAEIDLDEVQIAGRSLRIRGRLDRIDHHPQSDDWMIFDYKSSDSPRTPTETHLRRGEWVDLQLPLYRRLATRLGVPASAGLGYIALPKDTRKVGALVAEWTDDDLRLADATICETARRILEGEYWPPSPDFLYTDEFAWICQDQVFHRELETATS